MTAHEEICELIRTRPIDGSDLIPVDSQINDLANEIIKVCKDDLLSELQEAEDQSKRNIRILEEAIQIANNI